MSAPPAQRLVPVLIGALFALLLPSISRANLEIRVRSSTPVYDHPATFELSVVFRNRGSVPLVVLPHGLRRTYTAVGAGGAEYSPYPGPPMPPWKGAFSLRPGETRALTFAGMRDGDGTWKLEPGRYELRVGLSVRDEAAKAAQEHVAHFGATIWQGTLESSAIFVTYRPAPEMPRVLN